MTRRIMQASVHEFLFSNTCPPHPATLGGQVRQSVTESCPVGAIPIRMSWKRGRVDPYVEPLVGRPA